jgi:predicted DNA-binding protein
MSVNTIDVLVRFPKETAEELKAEKARTGCPTSEFIRRAVSEALRPGEKAE